MKKDQVSAALNLEQSVDSPVSGPALAADDNDYLPLPRIVCHIGWAREERERHALLRAGAGCSSGFGRLFLAG